MAIILYSDNNFWRFVNSIRFGGQTNLWIIITIHLKVFLVNNNYSLNY